LRTQCGQQARRQRCPSSRQRLENEVIGMDFRRLGQRELKETTQLGFVAAAIWSLCLDDASRPLIRPTPSARAVVAATKSNP
jgi:hypothetical protein